MLRKIMLTVVILNVVAPRVRLFDNGHFPEDFIETFCKLVEKRQFSNSAPLATDGERER
jgi:hypothetical protein